MAYDDMSSPESFGPLLSQSVAETDHRKHAKLFNDNVHGHFKLDPICLHVLDTPEFQRLRWLKQLGLAYYVFPGASHNRFEHSLGVAWKGREYAGHLLQQKPRSYTTDVMERVMDENDALLVELAGLSHDLGHGPFSHVFENELLPAIVQGFDHSWSHEDMSARILERIVDNSTEELGILRSDLDKVKAMMAGEVPTGVEPEQRFLYDIVANKRTGIDVDKFDYLARDSLMTGVKISVDMRRICELSRVIGGDICYKWSEYMEVFQLFQDRARMHQKVYTHRKAKAIEYMVVDALREAEPVLCIGERLADPADFLSLDDGLLRTLEALKPEETEYEKRVRDAQDILHRLHTRDLYMYITEWVVPKTYEGPLPNEEAIVAELQGAALSKDDLIVRMTCINMCKKDQNPLDSVRWYLSRDSTDTFPMNAQTQVTSFITDSFQERKVRVYLKKRDTKMGEAVHLAFRTWVMKHTKKETAEGFCTPYKRPRT